MPSSTLLNLLAERICFSQVPRPFGIEGKNKQCRYCDEEKLSRAKASRKAAPLRHYENLHIQAFYRFYRNCYLRDYRPRM